ncbi:hypothetical protein VUR80DRAFT_6178 [Thermomyces stellatus]
MTRANAHSGVVASVDEIWAASRRARLVVSIDAFAMGLELRVTIHEYGDCIRCCMSCWRWSAQTVTITVQTLVSEKTPHRMSQVSLYILRYRREFGHVEPASRIVPARRRARSGPVGSSRQPRRNAPSKQPGGDRRPEREHKQGESTLVGGRERPAQVDFT